MHFSAFMFTFLLIVLMTFICINDIHNLLMNSYFIDDIRNLCIMRQVQIKT